MNINLKAKNFATMAALNPEKIEGMAHELYTEISKLRLENERLINEVLELGSIHCVEPHEDDEVLGV